MGHIQVQVSKSSLHWKVPGKMSRLNYRRIFFYITERDCWHNRTYNFKWEEAAVTSENVIKDPVSTEAARVFMLNAGGEQQRQGQRWVCLSQMTSLCCAFLIVSILNNSMWKYQTRAPNRNRQNWWCYLDFPHWIFSSI